MLRAAVSKNPVAPFVIAARAFCAAIESGRALDAPELLGLLSRLHTAALDLPPASAGYGVVGPDVTAPAGWSAAPLQYYSTVLDPLELAAPELGTGDLLDDLTDTYCDLKRDLLLHEAGHAEEAVWSWRFGFQRHWGAHVVDAMRVLHAVNAR